VIRPQPPIANAGSPTGFDRSDGISSVPYRNPSGVVKELFLIGQQWQPPTDFSASPVLAPNAASDVAGYVRAENSSTIVYRAADNDIHELFLSIGFWSHADLSSVAGSVGLAVGNPVGYVRPDAVSAVVYRASSGHIRELELKPAGWSDVDLFTAPGVSPTPANAAFDPTAGRRSDGSAVVYYADSAGHIHEFALSAAGNWSTSDLSGAPGAAAAAGRPFFYNRADGVSAIVYRSADNHIRELSYYGTSWNGGDLSQISAAPAATGDPMGYVRSDSISAVVYRGTDNHVREIGLYDTNWIAGDLAPSGPFANSAPSGYVRTDGVSTVVFFTADNHVHELRLDPSTSPAWKDGDLTAIGGGP